jgi:mycoredoxin
MDNNKITMYGTPWCGDTIRAKKVFEEYSIEYQWVNINKDSKAEQIVKDLNNGYKSVPTIIFPDQSILVEPDKKTLIEKLKSLKII